MVTGSPEKQAYTISAADLLPQDEPDSGKETIAISQQDSGPEVIHFTASDRTIDGAYGATIAAVVRKYLDSGYARPEKECEVAALGLTYKVLKRQDITVFYTDTGRTVFDVENARLEEEYQYWNRNKGQPEPSGESQTGPEPPRPEQTHPEKSGKCIHRPEFDCTLEEAHKLIPGTGEDCSRVCCWECVRRGDCELECYSSQRRPAPQLSAYGTPRREYPADSLIATEGCEGGHDCFSCSMECEIRQAERRCVGASCGNPFPCEILMNLDGIREQTGERYYRYDLEDGTSMVVKVYHARIFDGYASGSYEAKYHDGYGRHEYYMLRDGKLFRDCETNRGLLIEKLKEIQKVKKGCN